MRQERSSPENRGKLRFYINGALAIAVENEKQTVRILFCIPEGLKPAELRRRIGLVETHAAALLGEWESAGYESEPRLTWDEGAQKWRPTPSERAAS